MNTPSPLTISRNIFVECGFMSYDSQKVLDGPNKQEHKRREISIDVTY